LYDANRFKEHLLWNIDTNGYYSSLTTKYLEYGNNNPDVSLLSESEALRTAFLLGHMLGRVVILPAFRCHGCVKTQSSTTNCTGTLAN
jgi:hypothetical protein